MAAILPRLNVLMTNQIAASQSKASSKFISPDRDLNMGRV